MLKAPGARLRVALVSEYYYPDVGGLPEHLHHLGRHLARRGHEVSILTTRFPGAGTPPLPACPEAPGLEVLRLGRSSGAVITNGSVSRAAVGLGLGRALRRLFAERRFDVIHVHGPLFPVLPLLAIRHAPPGAALVATLHTSFGGSPVMRLFRGALQRYLDALDVVLAVSESAAESLRGLGLRLAAEVVPNGVDLELWGGGRRLPELDDGKLNLLVQARLEPRAQLGALVQSLRALPPGAFRLLVVGDGPLRGAVEAAVPAELRGAVRFLGARIEGRDDLARSSDVYCFTAAIASHPMALLEGMAAGLPVVCHDIAGTRELVDDGVEGRIVPPGDAGAYGAALAGLLADPAARRRMGAAARRRAAAFAWPDVAARVEDAYREAIEKRKIAGT
jgi:phosphatidyl-myo-inositol alpha-mannosyltransferase